MRTIVKGLNKFVYGGYVFIRNLGAVALFAIFFAITAGIVSRYVFNRPFTWTEELTCFMMVHICFLSACCTTATDNHIVADFLVNKFPFKMQNIIKKFGRICQLFFDVILVVSSLQMLPKLNWRSPALSIPKQWYYATAIIGGIYMFITVITQELNELVPGYDLIKIKAEEAAKIAAEAEAKEAEEMMNDMDSFLDAAGIEHGSTSEEGDTDK